MSAIGPNTFHLHLRLLSTEGKPFADCAYEVRWGKKRRTGRTTAEGVVELFLDGAIRRGVLDLGELIDGMFTAYLTIPIEAVPPPPAPPPPLVIGGNNRPPKKKPPSPSSRSDEDPEPPPPQPPVFAPNSDASPQEWRAYQDAWKRWNEYEERQEQKRRDADERRREQEAWKEHREREDELRRQWKGGGSAAPDDEKPGPPKLDPKEKKRIEEVVSKERQRQFEIDRIFYELYWRLRNLGYVVEVFPFEFPVPGLSTQALIEGFNRYAHKNQLALLTAANMMDPKSSALLALDAHVKKAHDTKESP